MICNHAGERSRIGRSSCEGTTVNAVRQYLHEIATRCDQHIISLNVSTFMTQTFGFYDSVVTPAFEMLNQAFSTKSGPAVITRCQGWISVRVFQAAKQHEIYFAVKTRWGGTRIRVHSMMIITDHTGGYVKKTQALFGCKHKGLAEISQKEIVLGFVNLHERMISEE